MAAAGNKKPKKEKSNNHGKHIPSYLTDTVKSELDDLKKK